MKEYDVLYLCHDLLDFDGTRGDMIYFLHRLSEHGIKYRYKEHLVGEKIDVGNYDFIYAGVAPQKYEKLYLKCLLEDITGLSEYIEAGKAMLAVEQSFLFLGTSLEKDGEKQSLVGALPLEIKEMKEYTIGNILLDTTLQQGEGIKLQSKINGFFNSKYTFAGDGNSQHFGNVLLGQGYLWERGFEGIVYKNFIGTQLRGPLLPRNYDVCDYLIETMVGQKLPNISSNLEQKAKEKLTQDCEAFIESGEQKKEYVYVS